MPSLIELSGIYAQAVPIETPHAFGQWLKDATPGSACAYHMGHLPTDREVIVRDHSGKEVSRQVIDPVNALAHAAYKAYELGEVELVQKRVSHAAGCEYFAVKRAYGVDLDWE